MVPEHYAAFMEEMDEILPDFKYVTATEFIDSQVLPAGQGANGWFWP